MRYLMYFVHTMLTVRDVHHAEGTLPLNLSESQRSIEKSLTLHHSNMQARSSVSRNTTCVHVYVYRY